jgi:hypothetical protein
VNEIVVGSIALMALSLPGIGLGLALVSGKWRPASLAASRDPDRARAAAGCFLLGVNAMLAALGVLLLAVPEPQARPVALWGTLGIALASTLGVFPLLWATRG